MPLPIVESEGDSVPGHNNATFCTVPRSEQLFRIEYFEIAPLPMPVDRIFFTLLRGYIPANVTGLEDAKLRGTLSVELASPSDEPEGPTTFTIPLATFAADGVAHFTIRYPGGKFGGPLQAGVMNEIVTDYWFPGAFLKTGMWTFKFEGFIPGKRREDEAGKEETQKDEEGGDKYLFAFQTSQWLKSSGGMCVVQ